MGQGELDLIEESGWRAFPPRLFHRPIFSPGADEEYAVRIARDRVVASRVRKSARQLPDSLTMMRMEMAVEKTLRAAYDRRLQSGVERVASLLCKEIVSCYRPDRRLHFPFIIPFFGSIPKRMRGPLTERMREDGWQVEFPRLRNYWLGTVIASPLPARNDEQLSDLVV